jgi:hypothetical protein
MNIEKSDIQLHQFNTEWNNMAEVITYLKEIQ